LAAVASAVVAVVAVVAAVGGEPRAEAVARPRASSAAACSSRVAMRPSMFAAVSDAGYLPIACEPVTQAATAFGGALAPAYAVAYETVFENPALPAVVDDRGNAWVVTQAATGPSLEQVSPAGTRLWATALLGDASLVAGDSEVLVLRDASGRYVVFDTGTHRMTTVTPPDYEQAQAGQVNLRTVVGVVGGLAILETSQATGNGEGEATQPGSVAIERADGALVRVFDLPHKAVAAQPDEANDTSRIATFGAEAYLAWNDAPAGDQAGVFEIAASGQVDGSFAVPSTFAAGTSCDALALPNGQLLLRNVSTGAAALVSVRTGGVHVIWRRTIPGGAARLGGAYVVTAGATLRGFRLRDGAAVFAVSIPGYSLQPLVAGPFGVVAEAKSVSRSPQLVLVSTAGRIVWHKAVATGRMFPLATTVAGNPAIYLGPNLPVVVWR
jgi:hypothetical protein